MGSKDKSGFKVVIAGGSITGLTLANMLQLHGIDFVVLEAWHEMTPQVGASICMLPHGNRILDQLGLYEKVLELCPPLDSMHFRDHTGNIIHEFKGMKGSMHERHGYPITFLDRQMVLKVLYENVKDKSKILSSKRVNEVEMTDRGVIVKALDGSTYEGDILIGGDGIHSTVRSEMWRIANSERPGWIPSDEKQSVPCDFGCVFGISNPCPGVESGAFNSIFRKHQSYIVIGGPKGRVYWFFFFKLPTRLHGDDIPKYSEQDHDQVLKEAENNNITSSLKFKDLLNKKISSVLVPLQEYVFRQWHYKRIITIGDSAHKMHPITGHGGNACIESAATLVNGLVELLGRDSRDNSKPSLDDIDALFAKTQQARQARATLLKRHSHEQQRLELLDTPLHQLIAHYVLPMMDKEDVTFNFSRNLPLAERLDFPKPKHQAKLVPYKDELISTPTPRGVKKWLWVSFYLAVAALVHYGMWIWSAHYELGPHLISIIESGSFDGHPQFELQRRFTGIGPIDEYLQFLTAIFIPGINKWDLNYGTLSRLVMFLTVTQCAGIGTWMPIYYASYTLVSEPETYWWPLNRVVPIEYAVSVVWAQLGYIVPTILMFYPWNNPTLQQSFEALWQPSPFVAPLLCAVLGYLCSKMDSSKVVPRKLNDAFKDLLYLKFLYGSMASIGVFQHVYFLVKIRFSTEMTLSSVFWPDFSPEPKELGEGLRQLFLADFWGFQIGTYGWLCMAIWDIKRVGRTNVHIGKAIALITLGSLAIGPGATLCLVWYWRECAMAKTTFVLDRIPSGHGK
ncbi:unnamed protein product [Clonostachys byssicola]|uniref:FAD-binding domain-containing protein n=1 Tax=Clonostachys byssicola TaxID=160290 RepID=A0A9N9UBT8_9HYPO|nr:unnamed protein product [Clonostachys byssicola]